MSPMLVFSDFDGTICVRDTGTVIIDTGMGYDARRALDLQILNGTISFRDGVRQMFDSVTITWNEAVKLLHGAPLDPHFAALHDLCKEKKIPLTVLSSGIKPLIAKHLEDYLVTEDAEKEEEQGIMTLVANDVDYVEAEDGKSGKWNFLFRDDTPHGHDKGLSIKNYITEYQRTHRAPNNQRPYVVFIGDGISDISAAREADIIFAKRGKDLETWCVNSKVDYVPWDDFGIVVDTVRRKYVELVQ
ncbi:HAD-like domain-containing protein [Fimicolochytrium jonesii]|uniref:HAD-like domain-containing protein n=1 Tax=Fimicolochytrium jonesii TaxID=1396493 RepID=UPI0022FDCC24|nr:HAD-like domain-containing protein [Fimicolochytrium jonesii]KAI8827070.1 HAD-like domain-containing protein [Fimicolochytrium jonesii]